MRPATRRKQIIRTHKRAKLLPLAGRGLALDQVLLFSGKWLSKKVVVAGFQHPPSLPRKTDDLQDTDAEFGALKVDAQNGVAPQMSVVGNL